MTGGCPAGPAYSDEPALKALRQTTEKVRGSATVVETLCESCRPADLATLTPRQERERRYYDEFTRCNTPTRVSFDCVQGELRRPWNAYWQVFGYVRDRFAAGARRLLDFGCGDGVAAVQFAYIGYEVDGFDISPGRVETARRLADQYGYGSRTRFSVQTADRLTYAAAAFDVVVGIEILHHVDIAPAIAEVSRVLRPGGVGIFLEPVEVPLFDRVRRTRLLRRLFPPGGYLRSGARHVTQDERKLDADDLATIGRLFPDLEIRRSALFSRLGYFHRLQSWRLTPALEKLDHRLLRAVPALRPYGGRVVLILHKPPA